MKVYKVRLTHKDYDDEDDDFVWKWFTQNEDKFIEFFEVISEENVVSHLSGRELLVMNELIMNHNVGVKHALDGMKEVLDLYKNVISNYRPLLEGERYLTDSETAKSLKVNRRTLQEYRAHGIIPYILLGGKVLYLESDLERVLESCYHPAYR